MHLSKRTSYAIGAVFVLMGASGCKLIDRIMQEPTSEVKAVAAPTNPALLFDAAVKDAAIRTHATGKSAWLQEARDQLAYASGQLRELGGLMDPDRIDVELVQSQIKQDGGFTVVPFTAKFPVSWTE